MAYVTMVSRGLDSTVHVAHSLDSPMRGGYGPSPSCSRSLGGIGLSVRQPHQWWFQAEPWPASRRSIGDSGLARPLASTTSRLRSIQPWSIRSGFRPWLCRSEKLAFIKICNFTFHDVSDKDSFDAFR